MGYEYLYIVIEESKKFKDYLSKIREGFSLEEIIKAEGV